MSVLERIVLQKSFAEGVKILRAAGAIFV